MKKFRKIMAILVAALMIVTTWAPAMVFAAPTTGRMVVTKGYITINNSDNTSAEIDSTTPAAYKAYKLFDLASFSDDDTLLGADQHTTDAYAYVISTTLGDWVTWLNSHKVNGHELFEIDTNKTVTIVNSPLTPKTYYIVKPTTYFTNPFTGTSLDETSNVEWTTADTAQKFAQDVVARQGGLSTGKLKEFTVSTTETEVDLGYYVVDSNVGSLCSLDTTNNRVTIKDKNVNPTIDKKVQEDNKATTVGDPISSYVNQNDAEIGQTIYYRTVITVEKGAQNLVMHDQMAATLKWDDTKSGDAYTKVKVYLVDTDDTGIDNNADWKTAWKELKAGTVSINGGTTDTTTDFVATGTSDFYEVAAGTSPETFKITFKDEFLKFLSNQMNDNTKTDHYRLVVTYEAELKPEAKDTVNALEANANSVYLTFGDDRKSTVHTVYTATYSATINKYTTDNVTSGTKPLDKGIFQVKKFDGTVMQFEKLGNGLYLYDENVQNVSVTANGTNTDANAINEGTSGSRKIVDCLTTNEGALTIQGLDGDTYRLEEIVAPFGYNQLTKDIYFHVVSYSEATETDTSKQITYGSTPTPVTGTSNAGAVVYNLESSTTPTATTYNYAALGGLVDSKNKAVLVENRTMAELPSTGGMGTTVLYIVGGMLVILAGAYLFFSRKRTA